uniref:Uncharacterized protein n=1 Tax=Trichuris muris TaxID=70415 RepID=A0A5S6QSP5_TRIMR
MLAFPRIPVLPIISGMNPQSRRKFKDLCALCYNSLREWQNVSRKAWPVLERFANERVALLEDNHKQNVLAEMSAEDESSFELLRSSVDKFAALIQQLLTISNYLNGLIELLTSRSEASSSDMAVTKVSKVAEVVSDVLSTLKLDFECKRSIVSEIGAADNKDLVITYLAMWLHEPCIPDSSFSYPFLLLSSIASVEN